MTGLLAVFAIATAVPAQPGLPIEPEAKIRLEARQHSQLMQTEHVLADVYGARLTASPAALAAQKWSLDRMVSWGLANAHLEPWVFGHSGWSNISARGFIMSPAWAQLDFKVVAWTRGTGGMLRSDAVLIEPPRDTTRAQLLGYLVKVKALVRGRIVLVGPARLDSDDPFPPRLTNAKLDEILEARTPAAGMAGPPLKLTRAEADLVIDKFLVDAGARMRVDDAARPHGMIIAYANRTYEPSAAPPRVVLRHEDYGRIVRLLADGPVKLGFKIHNKFFPSGHVAYNAVAEIPGSDLKDQLVILGAHLDSWHSATGAVDNAIGCAIIMEAMRILKSVGIQPRRTVRIVLWTGEEQGLYGSQAYVAQHFGTAENPEPEFGKVAAYVNIDGGTGRIRAANIFGPPAAAQAVASALAPFADLGVKGAVAHAIRRLRSTDATTFSRAGLPAIGLIQDPIEYGNVNWHSNLDTYDAVLPTDAQDCAAVIAGLAYSLAMSDRPPARFGADNMPRPEGPAPALRPVDDAPR